MHWEKKICIRITIRRIVVTILAVSAVTNLIIAGTVFGADAPPTLTITPPRTASPSPPTVLIPNSGGGATTTVALTVTSDITDTPDISPSNTLTSTQTLLDSPGWMLCIKKFYWSTYVVQMGDTLFSLGLETGTTIEELRVANCLASDRIYVGQSLYVPRLPRSSATVIPSSTQTMTQTATSTSTHITLTATSTYTPTPSDTPVTPSLTPAPCDRVELLGDLTEPLGTEMAPGTSFTKTWRFRNIGRCTWTTAYALVFTSGEQFGAPAAITIPYDVGIGQTIDISVRMTAPDKPGLYRGYWMFRNSSGVPFGLGTQASDPWWVEISVADPTSTPGQPSVFQNPSFCIDSSKLVAVFLKFSVAISNVQDIVSVTAFGDPTLSVPMGDTGGGVYSGGAVNPGGYSAGMTVSYYFTIQDAFDHSIPSPKFTTILKGC